MATRRAIRNKINDLGNALQEAHAAEAARIAALREYISKRGISVPINDVLTLKFEYALTNASGDPVFRCKLPDTGIIASLYVPIYRYGMTYGLAFYNNADQYIEWIPNDLSDQGVYIGELSDRHEVANALRWVLDRINV